MSMSDEGLAQAQFEHALWPMDQLCLGIFGTPGHPDQVRKETQCDKGDSARQLSTRGGQCSLAAEGHRHGRGRR